MVQSQHLRVLLYSLAVLITLLGVMGAYHALSVSVEDPASGAAIQTAIRWISMLMAANTILLVIAMTMRILDTSEAPVLDATDAGAEFQDAEESEREV